MLEGVALDLFTALERAVDYMPLRTVDCRGESGIPGEGECGEPWCVGCWGEEDAERAIRRALQDLADMREVLRHADPNSGVPKAGRGAEWLLTGCSAKPSRAIIPRAGPARIACEVNEVARQQQEPTEATQGDLGAVGIPGLEAGEEVKTDAITDQQQSILRHALGLNRSRDSFRNYFVTYEGSDDFADCCALVDAEMMKVSKLSGGELSGGDDVFIVTAKGARAACG